MRANVRCKSCNELFNVIVENDSCEITKNEVCPYCNASLKDSRVEPLNDYDSDDLNDPTESVMNGR